MRDPLPSSGDRRAATGVPGLDDVLNGGLPSDRLYLVTGTPGVGKTTLALMFLLEGLRQGETCMYITLSESESEIRQVAASHGWSLDGLKLFELSSAEQTLRLEDENTIYATADVDLKETMRLLLDEVAQAHPTRVVFDSMAEVRLLAQAPLRYRRQLLSLKQFFAGRRCTVLLLDDRSGATGDIQVESLVHGVIGLEQTAMEYGADRRRLRVAKLRGSRFRSGHHDFVIETGGLRVFPRLVAAEHRTDFVAEPLPSGIGRLDALLGGGLDRSTATLIMGPAGSGKSALAVSFAAAAARRGEVAALFVFEERVGTLLSRARALGSPLDELIERGRIVLHQVDPAELAPDEFTALVRDAVEKKHARLVVIDSINGYFNAMPQARYLTLQMRELLAYLGELGVASILTMAQTGTLGASMGSPVDVSYLADTVVLLRYFEAQGRLRKAISVIKKRSGYHEDTIRELSFGRDGISLSQPLTGMTGILFGLPSSGEPGPGPSSGAS
ncbi:MAG TPA: ATPase domain-containing protein [Polyangiaceae bacterium]|nr:ATPase domain-containing protein [Polyangiaceae bacterium]